MATLIEKLDQLLEATDDRWPDLPDAVGEIVGIDFGDDIVALTVAALKALPDLLKVAQAARAQSACSVVHGGRPAGWTCLDEVRLAHDESANMGAEYRAKVLVLGYACNHCKLRAPLAPLLHDEPEGFTSELYGLEVGQ